jgi:cation:H+ antiporter
MEIVVHSAWLVFGLALLYFGAEWLVRGASEIALRSGLSPLVVGLTVVAFGTSAPELLVSMKANLDPTTEADIAVGNVIGSNICNIALLLGVAALIRPMRLSSQVVKRELPVLCGVSGLFAWMIWDRRLEHWEGFVLVGGIAVYLWTSVRFALKNPDDPLEEEIPEKVIEKARRAGGARWVVNLGLIVMGLGCLVWGAERLVGSGVVLARLAGVSEAVIGLTLVALGTSLPELATTIVASVRRQADIIAGNLVGSNLFNMMVVMGITASVKPVVAGGIQTVDLGVMLLATAVLVPFMISGFLLSRIEGAVLVVGYGVYCAWLVNPGLFGG